MKKFLTSIGLSLIGLVAWGQITVTGTVTSATDDEPIIGATVILKGATIGTPTDIDGNFTLNNVPANGTLTFSALGYEKLEVPVEGRNVINVVMNEQASLLDEVVVVGYGQVKRSDLTSSITTVKAEDITEVTTGNAMDALQGKVSGVQIASGGGPGTTPKVIIRGITSVNGSTPLYVVDGVPLNTSNINFINSNDIESMEVLKDASASAIYGTRASNGVIIITTKKGKAGAVQVDFSASIGWQTMTKPKVAWAHEYEQVFLKRYANDGRIAPWNSPYVDYADVDGTDWWNEVVNETALIQNYALGIRGGNDKFVYSLSIGYFKNNSQFDVGYWDKLNVRLNTEYTFNKYVKAGLDIAPNMENWENSPNLFAAAMAMDPTTPVFRPRSEWDPENPMNDYQRSYNNQEWNPAASLARYDDHTRKMALLMNPYIEIKPWEKLTFRTQFGINAWYQRADGYNYKFHIDALEQSDHNSVYRNYSDGLNWTWNNTLTYMDTFAGKHNLTAMVGFTAEKYQDWWANASRQDIPGSSSLLHEVSAGIGDQFASGSAGSTSLASFLGRVMYNFDQRYYLTASVRVDGSSRFPAGNKYGTFPSISLAWRLSQEKFMEGTRDWLNNAKIRFGWGQVGNQAIGSGDYLTTIANVNYVFGTPQNRYPSTIMGSMGNPNLKWETVEDLNLGIDLSLFNSRLNITADIYQKTSHDMLYGKQSQLIMGLPQWMGSVTQNIGSMRARGWELAVEWNDQVGKDFRYSIGVQMSGVRNKGLKFTGDGPILDGSGMPESIIRNDDNALISRFYGYKCLGIFQNWTDVYAHTNQHGALIQPDAQPGDLIFADLNHDGSLNEADKAFIGNPYPDLNLGLNMSFWYKDFDLTANFYGTFGNDIFNIQKTRYSGGGGQNVYRGTLDKAWSYEGQKTDIPRLSYNDLNQNYSRVSSFFVEDGSYFRCKLLTLGYTLPKSFMKEYNLRFYVSAQNLFTITDYTGMDPEVPFQNGGAIATGIDYNNYPNPRTFLIGIDFKF
ncbi:MAG: TonB-dependent receptor [Muribaculaceae bacterium]|nr:TonB-dependent receptor [Muribaculaceae bacterium]